MAKLTNGCSLAVCRESQLEQGLGYHSLNGVNVPPNGGSWVGRNYYRNLLPMKNYNNLVGLYIVGHTSRTYLLTEGVRIRRKPTVPFSPRKTAGTRIVSAFSAKRSFLSLSWARYGFWDKAFAQQKNGFSAGRKEPDACVHSWCGQSRDSRHRCVSACCCRCGCLRRERLRLIGNDLDRKQAVS